MSFMLWYNYGVCRAPEYGMNYRIHDMKKQDECHSFLKSYYEPYSASVDYFFPAV